MESHGPAKLRLSEPAPMAQLFGVRPTPISHPLVDAHGFPIMSIARLLVRLVGRSHDESADGIGCLLAPRVDLGTSEALM